MTENIEENIVDENSASEAVRQGLRLYNKGDYEGALGVFLKIPETDLDSEISRDLTYYTGLCYSKLNKYDDAILFLEQIVTSGVVDEKSKQCRMILAVLYIFTGRMRLADFELKKLLETGDETPQIYCAIAYIAWEQKKAEEAVEWYERALEIDRANCTALNGLGYVLCCSGGDIARALKLCRQACESFPDNPSYLDSLGWVYNKMGMAVEAKAYLRRALEKAPGNKTIKEHLDAVVNEGL